MKTINVSAAKSYIYIRVFYNSLLEWDGITHPDLMNTVRKIDL